MRPSGSSGGQHFGDIRRSLRRAGEDLFELAVAETEVTFEDGGEDGAVVGGDDEIAALVEPGPGEAGPIAVDAPAADAAAHHPDDIAVAVIGAAVAVLADRAAEL